MGLLALVATISLNSSYEAIITTDITQPLEKYVVKDIRELLEEYGFKLYPSDSGVPLTQSRFSLRKLIPADNYIWKNGTTLMILSNFRDEICKIRQEIFIKNKRIAHA